MSRRQSKNSSTNRRTVPWRIPASVACVWAIYLLKGSLWMRFYPLLVGLVVWGAFACSLFATPLVERIARARGHSLTPQAIRYTRKATQAWVIFLTLHLLVTAWTLFHPPACWALYNGCIAYALIGTMFAAEYLVRRHLLSRADD